MLGQKAVELAVKHIVARSTKQFFGYGPAERVTVAVQGNLVIFATRFSGPTILETLPRTEFGRLAMRHIADLFTREITPELVRVAREEFGVGLTAVCSDLDYEAGQSLGIALLDAPLPPLERSVDPGLARNLTDLLISATKQAGIELAAPPGVSRGPGALVLRTPALALPEGGADSRAEFAALTARESFRAQLRAGMSACLAERGIAVGPFFAVNCPAGFVAGVLLA